MGGLVSAFAVALACGVSLWYIIFHADTIYTRGDSKGLCDYFHIAQIVS